MRNKKRTKGMLPGAEASALRVILERPLRVTCTEAHARTCEHSRLVTGQGKFMTFFALGQVTITPSKSNRELYG